MAADAETPYRQWQCARLDANEVEDARRTVVEVRVQWSDVVLDVAHVEPGGVFAWPGSYMDVLDWRDGRAAPRVCVPDADASALYEIDGVPTELAGGERVELTLGARARVSRNGLSVWMRLVPRGRATRARNRLDRGMAVGLMFGVAVMASAWVMARAALPSLDNGDDMERLAHLVARSEGLSSEANARSSVSQGGADRFAPRDEGVAGDNVSPRMQRRIVTRETGHHAVLARRPPCGPIALRGVFAALGAPVGNDSLGSVAAVQSAGCAPSTVAGINPFGEMFAAGANNTTRIGNVTGERIGDAFGNGALGALGPGVGGGGCGCEAPRADVPRAVSAGLQSTLIQSTRVGVGLRDRTTRAIRDLLVAPPVVSAGLSPDAIRRVVRQNLGQIAHCHEQGLARDPSETGRVTVRFVVGDAGAVLGATVSESTVRDPATGACIADAARRWQFPAPRGGGVVTVNYPFVLETAR